MRIPPPIRAAFCAAGAACLLVAALLAGEEAGKALVLNELQASNRTTVFDEDGRTSDWIEILNRGPEALNLAGYTLSLEGPRGSKWTFPPVVVQGGERLIVWASGKDRGRMPPATLRRPAIPLSFERTFIARGEEWRYLLPTPDELGPPSGWNGREFDDGAFLVGRAGFGYADNDDATQVPEDTNAVFIRRKFQVDDPAALGQLILQIDYDDGFVAYLNGVRVAAVNSPVDHPDFNTIATDKHEPGTPENFDLTPYLEHVRRGENVLAIAGLNDRPSTDMTLIPALGTYPPICHTSFELPPAGGLVTLRAPDGSLLDRVEYVRQEEDRSCGRSPDGAEVWGHFLTPTPGKPNDARAFREPPRARVTFRPPAGLHRGPLKLEAAGECNAAPLAVRWTSDGSLPGPGSPALDAPLPVDSSAVFRLAGFIEEERATPPLSASYFVGGSFRLPVLSLSMEPKDFEEVHLQENARGRTAERVGFLELFDAGGERRAAGPCGVRLHGGVGRRGDLRTKKSYRIYFRSFHGLEALPWPVIPSSQRSSWRRLVLRGNFNDRFWPNQGVFNAGPAYIRDQVIRDLHLEMGAPASRGTWYALYVNMAFKGVYNVVERLDEDFLAGTLGGEAWDMVKTGNEVVTGTKEDWDALRRFVLDSDLTQEGPYRELEGRVDLENFNSYLILNLWAQNEDWPQNNWYAARRRPSGRWVFLSWDAEFGLGLIPRGHQSPSILTFFTRRGHLRDLFAALLTSAEYRERFRKDVERHLAGALRPEKVREAIARHQATVAPLMQAELDAWTPGRKVEMWTTNVEAMNRFASRRGAVFRGLVEAALEADPAPDPGCDRPLALGRDRQGPALIVQRNAEGRLEEVRPGESPSRRRPVRLEAGSTLPPAAGPPAGFLSPATGETVLLYRGQDGHLHALNRPAGQGVGGGQAAAGGKAAAGEQAGSLPWRHQDLTAAGLAAPAVGDPQALFWEAAGTGVAAYRGPGRQVQEVWFDGQWRRASPTLTAGSPRAMGEPALYVRSSDRTLHVVYRAEDSRLHELWLRAPGTGPSRRRTWYHTDLNRLAGTPVPGGDPSGASPPEGSTQHLAYRRWDGQVQAVHFQGSWTLEQAGEMAGAPPCQGRPEIHCGAGGQLEIVYRDGEGRIHRLLQENGLWRHQDLTAETDAPPAAADPSLWAPSAGQARQVLYRGADGRLHRLRFERSWTHQELGASAEGA